MADLFDTETIIPAEELKAFRDRIRRAAMDKIAPQASLVDEEEFFNREVESLLWDLGLLDLKENEDVKEFYMGLSEVGKKKEMVVMADILQQCTHFSF
jgi:hypothetical protein